MTTTRTATCTFRTAVAGACGKPAVETFVGRDGTVYAECADHVYRGPLPAGDFEVGDRVVVPYREGTRYGTIVEIRKTRMTVEITLADGRTKPLDFAIAAVAKVG